jgi:hypothetical protein
MGLTNDNIANYFTLDSNGNVIVNQSLIDTLGLTGSTGYGFNDS